MNGEQYKIADLTPEQLKEIEALQEQLGVVLVAYEQKQIITKDIGVLLKEFFITVRPPVGKRPTGGLFI